MATQKEVKNRIASVKNINKITRAMEMVAAARLRRAEQRIEALRPYAEGMRRLTRRAAENAGGVPRVPVLEEHDSEKRVGVMLITGDRGLAGAFNANIVRRSLEIARSERAEGREVVWLVVGRRGASTLRFRRQSVTADYTGITDRPTYADARAIAKRVAELYESGEIDRVVMVYNHFLSALSQRVDEVELLPVPEEALAGEAVKLEGSFIFEPDERDILHDLIPTYLEITIYRALLESTASEHGARMTAMRNASDNAGTLIDDLTLKMNRARQAEITQEILEVVAGADALT
jgi:F-type H+-transporting ATPase subunit gamma